MENKYEGHTLDEQLTIDDPDHTGAREILCGGGIVGWLTMADYPSANANAQLIAAAPDLLAEVLRLREQGRKLIEAAERVRSDISDQDTGWYYQLGNHIEKMNRLVIE